MGHLKKVKYATLLSLLFINHSFALGIFFSKDKTESLPEEENPATYGSYPNTPSPSHGQGGFNEYTTQPQESFAPPIQGGTGSPKNLNYDAALSLSRGLPSKVGNTKEMTYCARGVRWLTNTLFGRPQNADYTEQAVRACSLSETALNTGGLGSSSKKGYRYREVPAYSFKGTIPEGSILTCATVQNSLCQNKNGINNAGHAEMYLGGRFVSGANESASSACTSGNLGGQSAFTNVKIFVLEKT